MEGMKDKESLAAEGFRVGGLTIIEDIVASPRTTVLIKRDLGTTVVPQQ